MIRVIGFEVKDRLIQTINKEEIYDDQNGEAQEQVAQGGGRCFHPGKHSRLGWTKLLAN